MSSFKSQGKIETSIQNGVGTISFFHPASNSLPGILLGELAAAFRQIGQNPDVKVIVLRSNGDRAFCAGASFDELVAIDNMESGRKFFSGFAGVINAMRSTPQLIIGRVQGKTVGGGVGLASAVDYCIASEAASVKLSELAVGIGPFVVGPAVERKIGLSAMSALAINATEWQPASWALAKGLYAEVHPNIGSLDAAVSELAQKLAGSSPEAMRELKRVFWEGTDHWEQLLSIRAETSGRLVLSDFTKDFIASFQMGRRNQ